MKDFEDKICEVIPKMSEATLAKLVLDNADYFGEDLLTEAQAIVQKESNIFTYQVKIKEFIKELVKGVPIENSKETLLQLEEAISRIRFHDTEKADLFDISNLPGPFSIEEERKLINNLNETLSTIPDNIKPEEVDVPMAVLSSIRPGCNIGVDKLILENTKEE